MIYIDTNIFIYALQKHPKYGKSCSRILLDIELGKLSVCASMHLLAEILVTLNRINKELGTRINIQESIDAVLSYPITWFALDFIEIKLASKYNYPISSGDYIHIATAEINNVNEIISADSEFDKINFIKRIDPLKY